MNGSGIFKLLNSFFEYYSNKTPKTDDKTTNPPAVKDYAKDKNSDYKPNNNVKALPPLKENMLNTIKLHDEFVQRVYRKNK